MKRCPKCGRVEVYGRWQFFGSQAISYIYGKLGGKVTWEEVECGEKAYCKPANAVVQ